MGADEHDVYSSLGIVAPENLIYSVFRLVVKDKKPGLQRPCLQQLQVQAAWAAFEERGSTS
jgi:hypothetical protein